MGKTCLRAVIDHPDLELAGLYVYSEAKEGRDAGDIARREPTGIIATRDMQEILALDADVVLHCPLLQFPYDAHDEDVCRLLASGKNVISINNYFHPRSLGEAVAAQLADACEMPNAGYVFDVMGMGANPAGVDLEQGALATLFTAMYRQCIGALAERLSLPLTAIVSDHQVTLAPADIEARAGTIRAGSVAATNWQLHGMIGEQRVITHSVNWVMGRDVPGYENFSHWEVALRGKPGFDLRMDLVEPRDTGIKTTAVQCGMAGMVTAAIPHVVAAAPGFLTFPASPHYRAITES